MKKNGFLTQLLSVLFILSCAYSAQAARIKTFKAPQESSEKKTVSSRRTPTTANSRSRSTPAQKVRFHLAKKEQPKNRRKLTKNASTTYVMKGRVISSDQAQQELNKEKFAAAESEEITNENFPQIIESFDYPNADIIEVTKAISELTGKNFIIDPNVRGKVNIIAPTKITVAEAYKAYLSALAINGVAVVPSGPFLKLRPARNAQRDNIETYSGEYYPDYDQLVTRIIYLKHISAEEVAKTVRILPSKDGEITPYPQTNSLIITDYGGNINRVMKIIKKLDRPGFEEKMEVIPIRHATAKEMAELIVQIITKGQGIPKSSRRRGSFSSGIPRFGGQSSASSEVISIAVPDERTNSIIVVGNNAGIARIRRLVGRLDFKLNAEDSGGVHVYYVKYGEAEKIEETLNGIAQEDAKQKQQQTRSGRNEAPPSEQTEPIFGGNVRIAADKATNSIVITANKSDYQTVLGLLRKIDIPRDQVYVQAVIMEMQANNDDTKGVSYFYFKDGTDGLGRVGFNGGNFTDIANIGSPGAILGFAEGNDVEINVGGQNFTVKNFVSFINLLKTHTQSNILSTPQLLAMSNEKSTIEVGEDVPVSVTNSQNGTSTQQSVQREKVTVKLEVTPFISPDSEIVRMKIIQTARALVDSNVRAAQLNDIAVSFADRSIDTNIAVKSGNTAVMGGLIRTEVTDTTRKVPILGDIPILGWLFKSTSKQKRKTNLLVFITPKIMRNELDLKGVLKARLDERVDFIQENFNGRDPFGKQMDELMSGTLESSENDIIDETLTE